MLLFGDAAQSHYKLKAGFVVGITNSEMAEVNTQAAGSKLLTVKVMRSLQVVSLGVCSDFGICTVSYIS